MAKIKINGDSSGYVEIAAPNAAHNNTLELGPGTKILTDKNTHTSSIGIGTDNPSNDLVIESSGNGKGLVVRKTSVESAFLGHNGSGNEGLLILREGGTNRIQLYAESGQPSFINSGNLGLGTNTPDKLLTVSGSNTVSRFKSSTSYVDLIFQNNTKTNGFIQYNNSGNFNFYADSGSTSTLTITSGAPGNVGVGTIAPTGNFEVHGNDGINISNSYRTGTNGVQWRLIPHNGGSGQSPSNLRLYEGASATEVINITKTGRIGVNRMTPSFMLDIIGNSSTGANCIRIVDGAETGHGSHPAKIVAGGTYYHEMQMHSRRFTVHTWNGSNIAERFRVHQDGTVTTGGLSSIPGTVAAGSIISAAANAGVFVHGYDGKFGTSSNHPLYLQVNGVTKTTVTAGGAFSVGTTSPQQPNVPSMHLHSTSNDDARIAITTPSKPNSRIGYFGLSNKFGMDVHNGFEVRDASASYATRFAIDSVGRVTTPAQPSFKAKLNAATGANYSGILVFNNVSFNVGSHYNSSNGRFTAPVDGRYLFCWYDNVQLPSATALYVDWMINGNVQGNRIYTMWTTGWEGIAGSIIFDLNTNDYVQIYAYSSGNYDGGLYGSFSGCLLG